MPQPRTHREWMKPLGKKYFYDSIEVEPHDTLLVIDMQNDFVDGKLKTHDSKRIIPGIVKAIDLFHKWGALVVATRDYHPLKGKPHCSFPLFGEHCVHKTRGSDLVKKIENRLVKGGKFTKNSRVVFKAFDHRVDSFGALPYKKRNAKGRICGCTKKSCKHLRLTGSWGPKRWIRYPNMNRKYESLQRIMRRTNKKNDFIFICGVLGDYCVLDTAINACALGYKNVVVIIDLIRNLRIKVKGKITYPTSATTYDNLAKKHGFRFVLNRNII